MPPPTPSPDERRGERDALDAFMRRFFEDQDAGCVRSLAEYQAAYPGHEEEIATGYRVLLQSTADGARSALVGPLGSLDAGTRLGPYRIVSEIGRGGQGTVYVAEDTRVRRRVALKVLLPGLASDRGGWLARMRTEAEAASRVQHPGICPIWDVDVESELPYLAMPYLEGETLEERIASNGDAREPTPSADTIASTLTLVESVARALQAAHDASIVHRDVKPANVMVLDDGRPMLLDLGVARLDESELTRTGAMVGTLPYMSPEQIRAEAELDGRSDVYGLAVTLYECLTRRRPFEAPTQHDLTNAILHREAPDPRRRNPAISRDLAIVLETALAKERAHRYHSATAFAEDLAAVRQGRPIRAVAIGPVGRFARWVRREPRIAAAVGATLVTLLGAILIVGGLLARTRETLDERNELLDEFGRTSGQLLARDLLASEPTLWPATPERVPDLRTWLADADRLIASRSEHEARRARIAARLEGGPADPRERTTEQTRDAWLLSQLDLLLVELDELTAPMASVAERLAFAETVRASTVDAFTGAWARAARDVQDDARFDGFELTPITGLIPLGKDPVSELHEFAHLQTGVPVERDAETGALTRGREHGMVFVLLPGGETLWGGRLPDEEHELGEPWVDPELHEKYEDGLLEARIAPFLISKYEMTQAQWERHTGENPAYYWFGPDEVRYLRGIEQVSWLECRRVLFELGMSLPREAQWEYAARAGTTTIWFTGNEKESLEGYANISDSTARDTWKSPGYSYEEWLDDGHADPAPVGSYLPNAFGLHDVIGNVQEWCLEGWIWPGQEIVPRHSDRDPNTAKLITVRGGSFGSDASACRITARKGYAPSVRSRVVGLRPVIALTSRPSAPTASPPTKEPAPPDEE